MDAREADTVLAQARQGDGDAFRALVEAHAGQAFAVAYRLIGNQHDADDVVQESFIRAHRRLHAFESRSNFGTWLHRIVVNCALDLLRARRARREEPETMLESVGRVMASDGPSPERLASSTELRQRIDAAMEILSPLERVAFGLRHYEGRSIDEIGQALGIGEAAAKHAVFRAVRKMRAALAPLQGRS